MSLYVQMERLGRGSGMPRNYCHTSQTQYPLPDLSVVTAGRPVRRLVQNLFIVRDYYLSVKVQYSEILFFLFFFKQ